MTPVAGPRFVIQGLVAWAVLPVLAVGTAALREVVLVPTLGAAPALPLSGLVLTSLVFAVAGAGNSSHAGSRGRGRWRPVAPMLARIPGAAYACRERFLPLRRSLMSRVAIALMVVVGLSCVGDFARPAMVVAGGQDCFGPGCEHQISCGQPAQPQASSRSSIQVVALPAAVEGGPTCERTETPAIGPPPLSIAWPSIGQIAPRSPPAA